MLIGDCVSMPEIPDGGVHLPEINQIHNTDCIKGMRQMPDCSVDLVVTSPPYNLGIEYDKCDDRREWDEYYAWCEEWLKEVFRILKKDGRLCLNHYVSIGQKSDRHSPSANLEWIAKGIGFKHHATALWIKGAVSKKAWGSWRSASAPYINNPSEAILILYKEQWKKDKKGITQIQKEQFMELCSGVWEIHPEKKGLTEANFPIELPTNCILLLSYEGDMVLDPFMGSGTTAVACMRHNRNFIGFEISKKYCEIANERLRKEALVKDEVKNDEDRILRVSF